MRDFITFSQIINSVVGKSTDVYSATGTLHAKVSELRRAIYAGLNLPLTASNNLKASADTPRSHGGTSYIIQKSIDVIGGGTIRVSFDLNHSSGGATAQGRVYKNGAAVGTERSTSSTTPITFSEDITVSTGDDVQLYTKMTSVGSVGCRNFRVYYDEGTLTAKSTSTILD